MADGTEDFDDLCEILCRNGNIPVSELDWSDITKAIVGLTILTKDETYRSHVTNEIIRESKNIFEKSLEIEFDRGCVVRTHVFRLLRNCCVESRRNQECIINRGLLPLVVEILENVLNQDGPFPSDDIQGKVKQLVESGVQLLGNLVAGNEENQDTVWEKCYHKFFQSEMVITSEGISLTNSIVSMCCKNEKDVEWGFFILESLLVSGLFLSLYDGLHKNYQRIFLLELVEDKFKANQQSDVCLSWISVNDACYLAQIFEENVSRIIHSKLNFDIEETASQVVFISCLLRLLCLLTSLSEEYVDLRNRLSLLENTLVALRETSTAENKKLFSNVNKFPTTADGHEHSSHPTHGFKKNLVQLIANLCYHNKRNQDCVRQMDCIPILLDHCNVDDHNPYICQWAIFSLRNILENNTENQEVIKSLEKLGLAKNERLYDAGFLVEENAHNRITVESRKPKDVAGFHG